MYSLGGGGKKKVSMLLGESIVCIVFEFLYDIVISNLVLCCFGAKKGGVHLIGSQECFIRNVNKGHLIAVQYRREAKFPFDFCSYHRAIQCITSALCSKHFVSFIQRMSLFTPIHFLKARTI